MPRTIVVDAHAHVFNAGYLPLHGIFSSRTGGDYQRVIRGVVKLFEWLTDADEDLPSRLVERSAMRGTRAGLTEAEVADQLIDDFAQSVSDRFLEENEREIEEAFAAAVREDPASATLMIAEPDRPAALRGGWLRDKLARLIKWLAEKMAGGKPIVAWILLLLGSETSLVESLRSTWPDTTVFVHHMMDMDNHYPPGESMYPFVTLQMRRMRKLAPNAKGRLVGFVAYDPFRPKGVEIVEDALRRGFAGVKFYPPSGYKATGNTDADLRPPCPPAKDVNERNMALFKLCSDLDAPIFTHCSPGGMERWEGLNGSGLYSDPAYWRPALKDFPNLRLAFGHAGGDETWCAAPGKPPRHDYGPAVVELCETYPNVYCDFGHTEQLLLDSSARANFTKRLAAAVSNSAAKYPFGDKIMYGSDWHLLARTPDHERYDDVLRDEVFAKEPALKRYEERFFGGNALRYLNLPGFLGRSKGALSRDEVTYLEGL